MRETKMANEVTSFVAGQSGLSLRSLSLVIGQVTLKT